MRRYRLNRTLPWGDRMVAKGEIVELPSGQAKDWLTRGFIEAVDADPDEKKSSDAGRKR